MNTRLISTNIAILLTIVTHSVNGETLEQLAELTEVNNEYLQQMQEKTEFMTQIINQAKRVGYSHAYKNTMDDFKAKILAREDYWDSLLSFKQLTSLVQEGAAKGLYLKAGIVDRIDANTESVDQNVIYTNSGSYLMKAYPQLVIDQPNWRDYLFKQDELYLKLPTPTLLPRNEKEKAVWKENVEIGWQRGETSAYREIYHRWDVLFADLRGMTRYWTLVEMGKIHDVSLSIRAEPVIVDQYDSSEELTENPMVIKIDSQATFNPSLKDWNAVVTRPNEDRRSAVRDSIISGELNADEVSDSQIIVTTPEFERDYDSIPNTNIHK